MKRVEKIIRQILDDPEAAADGVLVNRLLDKFHDGAPLEYLHPLLLSPDPRIASSGAWIASELGSRGKPLLQIAFSLLRHADKRVRFWVIDCVLEWADSSNGREVAGVISLLDDPEKAVRWKTMMFLYRSSKDQLESALAWLSRNEPESAYLAGLRWLLSDSAQDAAEVEKMLEHPVDEMRKYGVVAAARMATSNKHPLTVAASSGEPDIVEFATDSLGFLDTPKKS